MSKYTTELRFLIESGFNLGLQDYPIFDETYRSALNSKIIEHYYFREIGFETAELFRRFLNRTMNEIMPYYNKLYQTELLRYDPLITRKLSETTSRKVTTEGMQDGSGSQNTTSTGTNNGKSVFSDLPQTPVDLDDVAGTVYGSTATVDRTVGETDSNTTNTSTATSTASSDENYERSYSGFEGDQSELLLNYRKTLLNIDMLIIEELNALFMGIW